MKEIFWKWLYIRDDIKWNPCHIWDKMKITRDWKYGNFEYGEDICWIVITWTLRLSKIRWAFLKVESWLIQRSEEWKYEKINIQYFYNLKLTDNCKCPQTWNLLFNIK